MELIRLRRDCREHERFRETVCRWYHEWWGAKAGCPREQIGELVRNSQQEGSRLPQLYVAVDGGEALGVFMISMSDDLVSRPDVYPWLANVYVDEALRGRGVGRFMLERVAGVMKEIGLPELYLYTKHVGLYEKFGWTFVENVNTYKADSPVEGLYRLTADKEGK